MAYCHGADYTMVYNDEFAGLLGSQHPSAWGQRAAEVMSELWSRPGYAGEVDDVFAGGPPFHDGGQMLDLTTRHEENLGWAYLSRSYSAVRDSHGSVLGILIVVAQIAPLLVLAGQTEHGDQRATSWRGIEQWDQSAARRSLIWSGFRAGARAPVANVAQPDQRFVADSSGHRSDNGRATTAGDFYDVFDTTGGRIAVTIGEVRGAGVEAASVATQIRAAFRGAALTSSDPNTIYATLDSLISHLDLRGQDPPRRDESPATGDVTGLGGGPLVTALLGIFDPATGELIVASAGHPPPATVRRRTTSGEQGHAGRLAEYTKLEPGPPLGVTGDRRILRLVLHEGDALVAFTEGLLERNQRSLADGQGMLLETLSAMSSTAPRSISQHLVDDIITDQGLEHDCALLVVVRDGRVHQVASVLVPPHPIAVRGARLWVHHQLESWDLDEEMVNATVLCVSELVTNAGQHAGTSARVTMELADRLLVTVEDTGRWSTPRARHEDHSAQDGRGLPLVAAFSDAMGYTQGANGSTVWFEMVRTTEAPGSDPDNAGRYEADPPIARS